MFKCSVLTFGLVLGAMLLVSSNVNAESKEAYHKRMLALYSPSHQFMSIKFPLSKTNPEFHSRALAKLAFAKKK